MANTEAQLMLEIAPWLLVAGPLAGAAIVYLVPALPWRLIGAGLVVAILFMEVL